MNGVSTRFISPDFLELNRAASPELLRRRCSIRQGPTIRVKCADFLDWMGAGSRDKMCGVERQLSANKRYSQGTKNPARAYHSGAIWWLKLRVLRRFDLSTPITDTGKAQTHQSESGWFGDGTYRGQRCDVGYTETTLLLRRCSSDGIEGV